MEVSKPDKVKNSKCKLCGHITVTVNAMRVHLNKIHGKSGKGLAEFISRTTDPAAKRQGRVKGSKNKSKTSGFECVICGHTCGSDAGIIGHLQVKHGKSGSMREFYKKTELPAKRKYNKRKKTVPGSLDLAGLNLPTARGLKFICNVDIEVDLSNGTCRILPKNGE